VWLQIEQDIAYDLAKTKQAEEDEYAKVLVNLDAERSAGAPRAPTTGQVLVGPFEGSGQRRGGTLRRPASLRGANRRLSDLQGGHRTRGVIPERKILREAMRRFTRRGQQGTAIVSGLPQRLRASLPARARRALATLLWGRG
jgi:hypothetical protein